MKCTSPTSNFSVSSDSVDFFYCNIENWGDQLNPYLLRKIVGKNREVRSISNLEREQLQHYLCIGSIASRATCYSWLWGTGSFMFARSFRFESTSFKVCSVRGPRTRKQLIDRGVECPENYGDPGLLVSLYYQPIPQIRHEVGIIPHHAELTDGTFNFSEVEQDHRLKVIDIRQSIESFIDEVCSCELIVSSALHGLIAADAYGIPSAWFYPRNYSLKDTVNNWKGAHQFKFHDYFESLGLNVNPTRLTPNPRGRDISRLADQASLKCTSLVAVQQKILADCPFAR